MTSFKKYGRTYSFLINQFLEIKSCFYLSKLRDKTNQLMEIKSRLYLWKSGNETYQLFEIKSRLYLWKSGDKTDQDSSVGDDPEEADADQVDWGADVHQLGDVRRFSVSPVELFGGFEQFFRLETTTFKWSVSCLRTF